MDPTLLKDPGPTTATPTADLAPAQARHLELERENAKLLLKYRIAFDGLARTLGACDWRFASEAMQKCIDLGDSTDGTTKTE